MKLKVSELRRIIREELEELASGEDNPETAESALVSAIANLAKKAKDATGKKPSSVKIDGKDFPVKLSDDEIDKIAGKKTEK